jgi:hypothetical protein
MTLQEILDIEDRRERRRALKKAWAEQDPELVRDVNEAFRTEDYSLMERDQEPLDPEYWGPQEWSAIRRRILEIASDLPSIQEDFVAGRVLALEKELASRGIIEAHPPGTFSGRLLTRIDGYREEFDLLVPDPLSELPDDALLDLLAYHGGFEYLDINDRDDDVGTMLEAHRDSGGAWEVRGDPEQIYEFLADEATFELNRLAESDPEHFIRLFVESLGQIEPSLADELLKLKLPEETMVAYALAFVANEEQGIELASQAVGRFGYEGSRATVLLSLDRDALAALPVIRGGRFWNAAPIVLVNLPLEELAFEGALQRHCVGRYDMGYRDAVDAGKTFIWSLRSGHGKPMLTWEVDANAWREAKTPEERGAAIHQIKGKLNRLPPRDEEEMRVILAVLQALDVDPEKVRDLQRAPR